MMTEKRDEPLETAKGLDEYMSSVLMNDIVGIAVLDADNVYRIFNRGAEELTGYKRRDLIGKPAPKRFFSEEDRRSIAQQIEASGAVENMEIRFARKDGGVKDIMLSMTVQRDSTGDITGYTQFLIDNTEKKHLQNLLLQAQKMEIVGEMAGGIAHDFNNLLEGILGYTTFMMDLIDEGHELRSYLEIIERSAKKASSLTDRLLTFSRDRGRDDSLVDCNTLLREVVKLLERTIDKRIIIELNLKKNLKPVQGAAGQLEAALLNVCLNARDAMPEGGKLLISSETVSVDDTYPVLSWKMKPGNYVRISISDTGMGMDQETKAKIFEPFFTTKKRGEGTGLGLNMVYGIIDKHDGFINVYSEIGQGTVVNIYLPSFEGEVQGAEERPDDTGEVPAGKNEVILVIDDEPIIRDLSREMLGTLGYEPLTAGGAVEGMGIFKEEISRINLVILDIIMPHASGQEVLKEIRALKPDILVLLTSGYNRTFIGDDIIDDENVYFIQKPYSMEELAREVRRLLDLKGR